MSTLPTFIVVPTILFRGWLIYSYLQIFKLIKCKWLPGECADWFFDNITTWSYIACIDDTACPGRKTTFWLMRMRWTVNLSH